MTCVCARGGHDDITHTQQCTQHTSLNNININIILDGGEVTHTAVIEALTHMNTHTHTHTHTMVADIMHTHEHTHTHTHTTTHTHTRRRRGGGGETT